MLAGDELFVEAWIANPGSSPSNLSGSYCSFVLQIVTGNSAEWILERHADADSGAILEVPGRPRP